MATELNAQNAHILNKLAEVQAAAQSLINEGLTVTHIEIEGAYPRINLLNGPRKQNSLPVSWKVIRPSASGREAEVGACVNGSEVRWLERA